MARVISLIIIPAPFPTMVAPRILSDFSSTRMRTMPVVSPSHSARSFSVNCFSKVLYLMPFLSQSFPYKPTEAISGSVNVAYGIKRLDILLRNPNSAFRTTARAMYSAACVNLNVEQQSPAAYIFELVVCNLSLTLIPTLLSNSTPAAPKSMPVTLGRGPVATRTASTNTTEILFSPSTSSRIWNDISGRPLSRIFPVSSMEMYSETESRNATPSSSSWAMIISE
mmetsp:Transcript_28881/g.60103  ORF Transcript_28881/g.60103 Transcript_28881/m.60103 type:complete len:225 (-) Transcript_28881:424-1098(-)